MICQEGFTCADSAVLGAAYTELSRQPLLGFIVTALEVKRCAQSLCCKGGQQTSRLIQQSAA